MKWRNTLEATERLACHSIQQDYEGDSSPLFIAIALCGSLYHSCGYSKGHGNLLQYVADQVLNDLHAVVYLSAAILEGSCCIANHVQTIGEAGMP